MQYMLNLVEVIWCCRNAEKCVFLVEGLKAPTHYLSDVTVSDLLKLLKLNHALAKIFFYIQHVCGNHRNTKN